MNKLQIAVGVISISTALLCALTMIKKTPVLSPQSINITDGEKAIYYVCPEYETHVLDKGRKGYFSVAKKIHNNPEPNELLVYLRILASYYDTYQKIGVDSLNRINDIEKTIHSFLESTQIDYQQVTVTTLYYDFNISDDRTIQLLQELKKHSDPYVAKFAKLSLERIYKRIGGGSSCKTVESKYLSQSKNSE